MNTGKAEQNYIDAFRALLKAKKKPSWRAIAVQAGRDETSLRKDRRHYYPTLVRLVEEYESSISRKKPATVVKEKTLKETYRGQRDDYKAMYHDALEKIVNLEQQVWSLQREIYALKGHKLLSESKEAPVH